MITDPSLPPQYRPEQILLAGAQTTPSNTISTNKGKHEPGIRRRSHRPRWDLISELNAAFQTGFTNDIMSGMRKQ